MSKRKASVVAAAIAALASPLFAAEPTTQELLEQIKALQAKVEQLEANQNQSGADVAATVQQIFEDANRRSKFLIDDGGAILAGHEREKFFIRSADGNYQISPSFELQIRNVTNLNTAGDGDSTENGFDIRRMKIRFEGHAVTPDLTYAFQWATNSSGSLVLEDAWARYQFKPGMFVRGGQYKNPLLHEQLISGRRQLAADRTLLALEMTGSSDNYIQGVSLIYDEDKQPWRAELAFTDGNDSQNQNWRDFPTNDANFGVAGRAEYFVQGQRKQYEDFTAIGNKEDLLVFGAGGDITQSGSDTTYRHTVDAQWENDQGWGAYAAYVARLIEGDVDEMYDWGMQAQISYAIDPRWEPFIRYDFIVLDQELAFPGGGTEDIFHEFTAGVNYYIQKHFAKFTLDASFLPNGAPSNQTGLGILSGDDAQFMLRGQFQLVL